MGSTNRDLHKTPILGFIDRSLLFRAFLFFPDEEKKKGGGVAVE